MQLENTFKNNSKTFSLAAKAFPEDIYNETTILYYYLRKMDDFYEGKNDLKPHEIDELEKIEEYLIKSNDISPKIFEEFKKTMKKDQKPIDLKTLDELIQYCYGAASTVGLFMCALFKINKTTALHHAIDLGIAMQITNICRDVYEDAKVKKYYLPALKENMIITNSQDTIQKIQKRYLEIADEYYQSGLNGLSYLPLRIRISVLIAAIWYKDIGNKIISQNNFKKRARTSLFRKLQLLLSTMPFLLIKSYFQNGRHKKELHQSLTQLPFTHE